MQKIVLHTGLLAKEFLHFENIDDIQVWSAPLYTEWHKEEQHAAIYGQEQTEAIKRYCGGDYQSINENLRACKEGPPSSKSPYSYIPKLVDELNLLLQEIPLTDNIIVFRSVHEKIFEQMLTAAKEIGYNTATKPQKYLLEYGFLSTSLLPTVFREYPEQNYKLRIFIPKCAVGAYVDFLSRRPTEREFLLSNKCLFKILSLSNQERKADCVLVKQKNKRLLCRHFLHL